MITKYIPYLFDSASLQNNNINSEYISSGGNSTYYKKYIKYLKKYDVSNHIINKTSPQIITPLIFFNNINPLTL